MLCTSYDLIFTLRGCKKLFLSSWFSLAQKISHTNHFTLVKSIGIHSGEEMQNFCSKYHRQNDELHGRRDREYINNARLHLQLAISLSFISFECIYIQNLYSMGYSKSIYHQHFYRKYKLLFD